MCSVFFSSFNSILSVFFSSIASISIVIKCSGFMGGFFHLSNFRLFQEISIHNPPTNYFIISLWLVFFLGEITFDEHEIQYFGTANMSQIGIYLNVFINSVHQHFWLLRRNIARFFHFEFHIFYRHFSFMRRSNIIFWIFFSSPSSPCFYLFDLFESFVHVSHLKFTVILIIY